LGIFSEGISTLDDLLVHTLQDIYYAEQEILKALPSMIKKATNSQLKSGLERHLAETRNHAVSFQKVVHSVLTEEAEVCESSVFPGDPNGRA
jgi:ferritin-like metal-binding protein YciE